MNPASAVFNVKVGVQTQGYVKQFRNHGSYSKMDSLIQYMIHFRLFGLQIYPVV